MTRTLSNAELQLGAWCGIPSAYAAELVLRAGYDWVCIDTQHGLIDFAEAVNILQTARIYETPALVRVPAVEDVAAIMRYLDSGATGVLVPLINTREQAERAVAACRYPPDGIRSWGPVRALPAGPGYTASAANQKVVCGVQIETLEAISNIDEILSVPGVDFALVGPSDLAVALGLTPTPGAIAGPHREAIIHILERCNRANVLAAIYAGSAAAAIEFYDIGYRSIAVASDARVLAQGALDAIGFVKAHAAQGQGTGRVTERGDSALASQEPS